MADQPPDEIMALIDSVFNAYNSKNHALMSSIYGDDVVIVDGFGPFRWFGPNAFNNWWADAEKWVQAGGVEKEHLVNQGVLTWGLSGNRAYASISAILTITLKKGEPIIRPGILTYSFAKTGDVWKAEGHTWGRLS
jgi:ketosteroid isomerase-like protein